MEEALLALLGGEASITAHIPLARMSWTEAGQGTDVPYLVLLLVSDQQDLHMNGANVLRETRVQFDLYADRTAELVAASGAILAFLNGYRSGSFRHVQHDGTRDFPGERANRKAGPVRFRRSMDFIINWRPD